MEKEIAASAGSVRNNFWLGAACVRASLVHTCGSKSETEGKGKSELCLDSVLFAQNSPFLQTSPRPSRWKAQQLQRDEPVDFDGTTGQL